MNKLVLLKRAFPDVRQWRNAEFVRDFGFCPKSKWYRSPSWEEYKIWNRKYGFQHYMDVGNGVVWYREAAKYIR